ncbi:MT-A70 family methyltransferase [Nocardia amikacinitolerans]|uniref:MT-A70 family methyltransferase n=1 Tax=Nocardia amikacinitolerans TaxID=756689 RepID=UPI0020A5916A|nr:MT-A70 family methyltransferase [Nocardia amikacinitolerans]MCP2290949.1 N6-adenosine-specific RNA methylase IME4 [Nocardia amikacinitolerans]
MSDSFIRSTQPRRFGCVVADPPWDVHQKGARGAIQHYPLMPLEAIKGMPVADFMADNSHCWIWTTNATLRDGYDVLEAWGFSPRSPLTWVKPRMGLGVYLRNTTEHLILGTRGNAPVNFRGQPTWVFAPVQDHSHKPEEQYAIIERVSGGPYLELFARRRQPNWAAWGNEIPDSDIVIPGYPVTSDALHIQSEDTA